MCAWLAWPTHLPSERTTVVRMKYCFFFVFYENGEMITFLELVIDEIQDFNMDQIWRSHVSGADHSSRNCPEWSIITYDMYFYLMYFLAQVKDICWGADKTDKVTGPLWIQSFVNLMEGTGGRAGCIWIWRSGWLCVVIILTIAICSWLPMWGYTHTQKSHQGSVWLQSCDL